MEYKKIGQYAIIAVVGVWVFCLSFFISMQIAKNDNQDTTLSPYDITTATPGSPQANATTAPRNDAVGNNAAPPVTVGDPDWLVTEDPAQIAASLQAQPSTQAPAPSGSNTPTVPKTNKEIADAYVTAVNNLKNQSNFSLYKDDKLNIVIDSITGGSLVEAFVSGVLDANKKAPVAYTFANGFDAATGATPASVIAPLGKLASINEGFITSATATPSGDGGYTINMTFADEAQIYPAEAVNHANLVEVVDVTPLIPSGGVLDRMELYYTGTSIEARIDSQGRITYMKHYLNVSHCEGSGHMSVFTLDMQMHGDFVSEYTFSY